MNSPLHRALLQDAPLGGSAKVHPMPADSARPCAARARRPRLSCVLPCRNEAANLALLLPQLRTVLTSHAAEWEVIMVDDGSSDGSTELLARWAGSPGFRLLQLSRNFGKEAALSAGLDAAAGEVVLLMDADLQHSPDLVAPMIERWQGGADVVYAVREDRADEGPLKRLGAHWFYRLLNLNERFDVPPGAGDFRLLDRSAVDALLALPERNRFMKGLYAWVGFNAVALPYTPEPRAHGRSHFRLGHLLQLSIDGLTSFTTWPLRLASVAGFALAALSFLYGGYLVVMYLLHGHQVSGWTTIVVCLLFFSGVQMISLGIVGEYIARIFEEVKARPLYVVKRRLGRGLGEPEAIRP